MQDAEYMCDALVNLCLGEIIKYPLDRTCHQ